MDTNEGTIYLSGGGDADKTTIIDTHFIKSLPKKDILYIPVAMERDLIGYEACYDWFTNTISKISEEFVDISMILNLKEIKDLKQFSAIYIGGGNTYKLLKEINQSGFGIQLKEYIKAGGIVYGGSAGAIILGKDISTVIDENKKYNYNFSSGLSLIGNYSVVCHYKEGEDEKIREYLKNNNNPIIAIPEGAGLMVKMNSMLAIGSYPVIVYENDGSVRKILPGDILEI
ncbi:MAG: Type 1 glutamine amidotransferase-like domain-containing protein [bacterium]